MRIAGLQKLTLLDFPRGKTAGHGIHVPGLQLPLPVLPQRRLGDGRGGARWRGRGQQRPIDRRALRVPRQTPGGCSTACASQAVNRCCSPVSMSSALACTSSGFAVKLDTNGSFPGRLRALVEEGLVDYVATDVKNAPERYAETVGVPAFDLAPVQESLDFLRFGAVPLRGAHHRGARAAHRRRPARAGCVDRRRTSVAPAKLHRRGQRAGRRRSLPRMGPRRPAGTAARAAGRRAGRSAARVD